jgi:hypothetical protein
MPDVTINILDEIGTHNAIIKKFGETIHKLAYSYLKSNNSILLDFDGITNLTSGFCNASIGKLYLDFPITAENLIHFTNLNNKLWEEKIDDAINLAKNPEGSKLFDSALAALFAD